MSDSVDIPIQPNYAVRLSGEREVAVCASTCPQYRPTQNQGDRAHGTCEMRVRAGGRPHPTIVGVACEPWFLYQLDRAQEAAASASKQCARAQRARDLTYAELGKIIADKDDALAVAAAATASVGEMKAQLEEMQRANARDVELAYHNGVGTVFQRLGLHWRRDVQHCNAEMDALCARLDAASELEKTAAVERERATITRDAGHLQGLQEAVLIFSDSAPSDAEGCRAELSSLASDLEEKSSAILGVSFANLESRLQETAWGSLRAEDRAEILDAATASRGAEVDESSPFGRGVKFVFDNLGVEWENGVEYWRRVITEAKLAMQDLPPLKARVQELESQLQRRDAEAADCDAPPPPCSDESNRGLGYVAVLAAAGLPVTDESWNLTAEEVVRMVRAIPLELRRLLQDGERLGRGEVTQQIWRAAGMSGTFTGGPDELAESLLAEGQKRLDAAIAEFER